MSENDQISGTTPEGAAEPSGQQEQAGSSKRRLALFGGLGAFAVLGVFVLLLVAFIVFDPFGLVARLFGGGDPIAAMIPTDVPIFASVDLLKLQSEEVDELVAVFSDLVEEEGEEVKTLIDLVDEDLEDGLGLTFSGDVLPWIGQYAGFMLTDLDFDIYSGSEDAKFLGILEVRDKEGADAFLVKYVAALEESEDITFEMLEQEGASFYVYSAESDFESDLVISRVDSYLFWGTSVEMILNAVNMEEENSLEKNALYQQAVENLPANRIMTFFADGEAYVDMLSSVTFDASSTAMTEQLEDIGVGSFGFSLSVEEAGLRMDSVSVYDPENISDYHATLLGAEYSLPTTDALVPEDTFFYLGVNSSVNNVSTIFSEDSPFYTAEIEESMELFESQLGVDILELFNLMTGEVAFAFAPAGDGLFAEALEVNLGFTMLVGTDDEAGFEAWIEPLFTPFLADPSITLEDFQAGDDYNLHALGVYDGYAEESITGLVYGADNGFIVFGISPGMLEDGFGSGPSLADNPLYQETWTAFSPESIPYIYLDVQGLMSLIEESMDDFLMDDYRENSEVFTPITVVAGTVGKPSETVQTATIIIFIDTNSNGE